MKLVYMFGFFWVSEKIFIGFIYSTPAGDALTITGGLSMSKLGKTNFT